MVTLMMLSLLCMPADQYFEELWLPSFVAFLVLAFSGSIIILCAISKWPEATYFELKLEEVDKSRGCS